MLSRVANSLYWMSRYLERANNVARFIDVNMRLILDMCLDQQNGQWEALINTTGDEEVFFERYQECNEQSAIYFLTFDPLNQNSILSCVQNARENARTVREMIPSELWETINSFYHAVRKNSEKQSIDDLQDFYASVKQFGNIMSGMVHDGIVHGEAWHFVRLGQMLERADKTARMLDVKYFLLLPTQEIINSPTDVVEWGAVLKSVSGFEAYRKIYHRVNYRDVTDFLMFNRLFPRSILFCVEEATKSLYAIIRHHQLDVVAEAQMMHLNKLLANSDCNQVLTVGLHEYIDDFQKALNEVDDAIYQSFFAVKESLAASA